VGHLASCAQCQAEQRLFLASVSDFNNASLAWVGSKAISGHHVARKPRSLRSAWSPAGLAFAAAALLAVAVPTWIHYHPSASASEDSAAAIAQDNKLMQSVSIALATEDESPLSEYHLPAERTVGSKTVGKLRKR
jgi:hypothetical protein